MRRFFEKLNFISIVLNTFQLRAVIHATKTAIAAVIATFVYLHFNLPHGYWVVISAVIVMQSSIETGSIGSTLKNGFERILGTLIGAAIGIVFVSFIGQNLWINLVTIFLVILSTCYLTFIYGGLRMVGLTAAIVILMQLQHDSSYAIAYYRAFEIVLGSLIAVLVTILIYPYRSTDYIKHEITKALNAIKFPFNQVMLTYLGEIKNVRDEFCDSLKSIDMILYKIKAFSIQNRAIEYVRIIELVQKMVKQLEQMHDSVMVAKQYLQDDRLLEVIKELQIEIDRRDELLPEKILEITQQQENKSLILWLEKIDLVIAAIRKDRSRVIADKVTIDNIFGFFAFLYGCKTFVMLLLELHEAMATV